MSYSGNGTNTFGKLASAPLSGTRYKTAISGWVKIPALPPSAQAIVSMTAAGSNVLNALSVEVLNVAGVARLRPNARNSVGLASGNAIPLNQWTFFAALYESASSRFAWVAGAKAQQTTNVGGYPSTAMVEWILGGAPSAGSVLQHLNGKVAEVSFWFGRLPTDADLLMLEAGQFAPQLSANPPNVHYRFLLDAKCWQATDDAASDFAITNAVFDADHPPVAPSSSGGLMLRRGFTGGLAA